jgi:hypothetical protein
MIPTKRYFIFWLIGLLEAEYYNKVLQNSICASTIVPGPIPPAKKSQIAVTFCREIGTYSVKPLKKGLRAKNE